jgi:hypothetical protein
MPASKLETLLLADYEEQGDLLTDPETRAEAIAWMGSDAFKEFERFLPDRSDLSAANPKNVIFVPGVMGSTLQSNGLGGIWWVDMVRARDKVDRLKLSDDGLCDADPDAIVGAGAIDISYVPCRSAIARSSQFGGSVQC